MTHREKWAQSKPADVLHAFSPETQVKDTRAQHSGHTKSSYFESDFLTGRLPSRPVLSDVAGAFYARTNILWLAFESSNSVLMTKPDYSFLSKRFS